MAPHEWNINSIIPHKAAPDQPSRLGYQTHATRKGVTSSTQDHSQIPSPPIFGR